MFAELAAISNFSFLRGASHPEELVVAAAAAGYSGIAVCDYNSLAGVVRCHLAAKNVGLRSAVGVWLSFSDQMPDILCWPTDRAAYGRLCRLLTTGNLRGEKGHCHLLFSDLVEWSEGQIIAIVARSQPAERIRQAHASLKGCATEPVRLAVTVPYGRFDARALRRDLALAKELGTAPLATNQPLYHAPERKPLQDVLTAIGAHTSVDEAGRLLEANAERHIKSVNDLSRLFALCPEALRETVNVLDRINFSLDELRYEYPEEPTDPGRSPQETLVRLTEDGMRHRFPKGVPSHVETTIGHELDLIEKLDYAPYFLTVYDIVRFARDRGILAQGRGSAANSAVCYCLGITEVDPSRGDLLFERFISPERREPPDIDVDFEHERREEVIQYIYNKYGRERAGLAATVITYRARSSAREIGKALGLSQDAVSALSSTIWGWSTHGVAERDAERAGLHPNDHKIAHLIRLSHEIAGFPRHLSQHVGGFVITRGRLDELVPITKAAMEDRTTIEWDKDDIDALGILKIDVLALGMLTCLRKCLSFIADHYRDDFPQTAIAAQPPFDTSIDRRDRNARSGEEPDYLAGDPAKRVFSIDLNDTTIDKQIPSNYYLNNQSFVESSNPKTYNRRDYYSVHQKEGPTSDQDMTRRGPSEPPQGVPQYDAWPINLATIPPDDPEVFDMICRADTLGVFQIESRAQMTMLPRLRPRTFYDLVIEVAIVRPGPIQGDMVHPYLRRRQGKEPVTYPSKELEAVLSKTLGVPLFQEQAMRIAIVAAGFTPSEADQLRRAMATFRKVGTIGTFQEKMVEGMKAKGYDPAFADRCFKQIEGFGEYGFPESHAASFALLVYASCWMKCHYPDVFCAALLNSQPMGFYAPSQIVRDARQHGVEVRPVDVNLSQWDCTLEPGPPARERLHDDHREMAGAIRSRHAVRLGLRQVKGLGEAQMEVLLSRRGQGYDSVRDVWLRTGLKRAAIERLADADAFRSIGLSRRDALWAARGLDKDGRAEDLPLFAAADWADLQQEAPAMLPPMPPGEEVIQDYRFLSLSLRAHPAQYVRAQLAREGVMPCADLKRARQGQRVCVTGLVLVRQRPGSAKGVIFMTLEDEGGIANVIVWPKVFEAHRQVVLQARFTKVFGRLQREDDVIHVVAERLEDATGMLNALTDDNNDWDVLDHADEVKRPSVDLRTVVKARSRLARLVDEAPELRGDLADLLKTNRTVVDALAAHAKAAAAIAARASNDGSGPDEPMAASRPGEETPDRRQARTTAPAPSSSWGTARSAASDLSRLGEPRRATRTALPKGRNFH